MLCQGGFDRATDADDESFLFSMGSYAVESSFDVEHGHGPDELHAVRGGRNCLI
jgi:hypothetical protein